MHDRLSGNYFNHAKRDTLLVEVCTDKSHDLISFCGGFGSELSLPKIDHVLKDCHACGADLFSPILSAYITWGNGLHRSVSSRRYTRL